MERKNQKYTPGSFKLILPTSSSLSTRTYVSSPWLTNASLFNILVTTMYTASGTYQQKLCQLAEWSWEKVMRMNMALVPWVYRAPREPVYTGEVTALTMLSCSWISTSEHLLVILLPHLRGRVCFSETFSAEKSWASADEEFRGYNAGLIPHRGPLTDSMAGRPAANSLWGYALLSMQNDLQFANCYFGVFANKWLNVALALKPN